MDSGDQKLLQRVQRHLLSGGYVFLTGCAGTGKTYFVKRLVRSLASAEHVVTITASTGIAATHLFDELSGTNSPWIRGPSTLHSAARLPLSYEDDTASMCEQGWQRLLDTEVLVIDEISMTDSRTFDCLMQRTHDRLGILAVGDFFQLPPVSEDDRGEPNYAFRSAAFVDFKVVELTRVYRQDEPEFIQFLGQVRHGQADHRFYARLAQEFDLQHPVLFGTRREADTHNHKEIEKIDSPSVIAGFHVAVGEHEAVVRWFDSYTRAVQVLKLKRGMRILCIRNHNSLVNGDLGTVVDIADHESVCGPAWIDIEMDRIGRVRSFPFRFELKRRVRGQENTVYAVQQFPFLPAYGLTVHKAQGMTLDVVNVDGSRINFAAGHVYVALSRCRTMAGLRVANASQFAAFTRPSVERYYEMAETL